MSKIHDAIDSLQATAKKAYEFFDPAAENAKKEAEFKAAVADTVHELEQRVAELERQHEELRAASEAAKDSEAAPAIVIQPTSL